MNTARIMLLVLLALIPGITAMTYVWGVGVLWNVALTSLFCWLAESLCLWANGVRALPQIMAQLRDHTTVVTAWLMAICLPPFTAVWLLVLASFAAICVAKHAYGGLGRNIFNPAMVGYAVLLVSFPAQLAAWPVLNGNDIDAYTGATLLTDFRYRVGMTTAEFDSVFTQAIGQQRLIAFSFLAGGLALAYKKLLAWRIPAAMFAGIAFCSLFGYDQGSSMSHGSAWFHWTTGGFIAAAFFVATDPVTHPRQHRHQILFGFVIGIVVYVIRTYGSYPDGIAFAVLFANCLTPLLNRWAMQTQAKAPSHV